MKIGRFEVRALNFGFFRLDGGAMFGSVPKNLWSRLIPVDDENCIPLAARCLLIDDGDRRFLVDVGLGDKYSDKMRQIFAIRNFTFDELGFNPDSVTDVILTHLHFDHAGGISRYKDGSTELELVYPKARVWLQEANYTNARSPHMRERASYLKENVEILKDANLNLLSGACEIHPGIRVHVVNGHTKGQQWIEVSDGDVSLVYPTDLIPTSRHLPIPYHMGYDMCAETVLREREDFLSFVLQHDSIIVFEHDPDLPAARVSVSDKGHYVPREVITL